MLVDELDTPALLIDLDALQANIATLMDRLRPSGVAVRPHLKTAKCPQVAQLLAEAGCRGFCVAKLGEAELLAEAGIDDLLITSEIAGAAKLARMAVLHQRHPRVKIVVDSVAGARALDAACAGETPLDVLIELDVGQGRCGVAPGEPALALARELRQLPNLQLVGLQGYEGHLQQVADRQEKARRVDAAMDQLLGTAALLRDAGVAIEVVTTGGTGTCELCARHNGVTEVQPGSFVFLDISYRDSLGPGANYANALVVLATVVSRPTPNRAVIDAGLKALSTDMGNAEPLGLAGARYRPGGDEHGIIDLPDGQEAALAIGSQVMLLPSHIDTTVNLHDVFQVRRAEMVIASWPVATRGKIQ
ncbi:MAG TPA: DSD1 family PLP-dependent enzyme [Roseiflexaceae bacterium]|nr:DSD1 family PLP-dependent enzyme [Roseiflexaceae bacterium]